MFRSFDEKEIRDAIGEMPWEMALAFGAACAGRILPNYYHFAAETGWGSPPAVASSHAFVCAIARGQRQIADSEVAEELASLETQAPDSENFTSLFTSGAQDVVFAICSLLDFCRTRTAESIIIAARYPIDSIDLYVQEIERMDPRSNDREQRILAAPLMQQELLRQNRDLDLLKQRPDVGTVEQVLNRCALEKAFEMQVGS